MSVMGNMGAEDGEVVRDSWMYKLTLRSDLVVKRKVQLLSSGVFYTFHNFEAAPEDKKAWYLAARCAQSLCTSAWGTPASPSPISAACRCRMQPERAEEIVDGSRKVIRAKGQW
jgi:hypothetical protein